MRRILRTPRPTKSRATRLISSKVRMSSFGRNRYRSPKISAGMQKVHLKLHRSVTEMRRSRSGLP